MSQQPSSSRQNPNVPARDWTQASDMDLEVHTSNSEGTEQAKETEKGRREVLRKEKRAEAHRQKVEEARLERERRECEEREKREREEREAQERQARKEQERREALETACRAAVAEAEAVQQSIAREKGRVGELQSESRGSSVGSPTTGTSLGVVAVTPTPQRSACKGCRQRGEKRKKKCSWAAQDEEEAVAGGSRKRAGMGGSRGSGRKKGQADEEDDDNEIEEVPGPVTSHPEASGSGPAREGSEFGRLGQGVPGPLYDERMLVIQARQAAAMERQALVMERMAGAMEAQAVAVCVYMQRQPVFPPWPPGGLAGAAPGASRAVVGESRSSSRESGAAPAWGEAAVGGGVRGSGEEGDQDAEGDVEGMQE
ncbi:hypothetical protein EDD16DRAFT_1712015 [Pisolithus croceorrhizus]|nr:hypothetical protein EDD16DRAFT_1712015 [Pisolithus croceorrhizus]